MNAVKVIERGGLAKASLIFQDPQLNRQIRVVAGTLKKRQGLLRLALFLLRCYRHGLIACQLLEHCTRRRTVEVGHETEFVLKELPPCALLKLGDLVPDLCFGNFNFLMVVFAATPSLRRITKARDPMIPPTASLISTIGQLSWMVSSHRQRSTADCGSKKDVEVKTWCGVATTASLMLAYLRSTSDVP